jgi:hypothetical protein
MLGKLLAKTWPVIVIAGALGFLPFFLPLLIPFTIEDGLFFAAIVGFGIWIFSMVVVLIAALVTKQRNPAILARRVWILAAFLMVIAIIRNLPIQ